MTRPCACRSPSQTSPRTIKYRRNDRSYARSTQCVGPGREGHGLAVGRTRGRGHVRRGGLTVTAALLKGAGYDVVGVTLQLYDHGAALAKKGACCAGQDILDARMAAQAIGMPHYVLDYESRFRQEVIEDFADAYLRGETPIPCIRCNQTVKFRDLMEVARDLGAQALATGHYAQRLMGASGAQLRRAADPARDQSYFLFATTRGQLDFLRFPLGGLDKPQVRAEAARLGLSAAEKPDSQDICFVPEGKYTTVIDRLRRRAPSRRDRAPGRARSGPPRGRDPLYRRPAARSDHRGG